MARLSKEEALSRISAANRMFAEMGMAGKVEEARLLDCLSATKYFNFAFRFWVKYIKRQEKSKKYKAMHHEYLETEKWKEKREERMKIDKYKCVDCGNHAQCVHHKHYLTWRNEDVAFDLVSLCNDCHYKRHFGDGKAAKDG